MKEKEMESGLDREVSDEVLGSAAQQAMRSLVKGLPEENVGMAWRDSLNEKLAREANCTQHAVRSMVKSLPEESLSLAWRSSLNERLRKEAALRQRRTRIALFLRPALGLGLAFGLAVLVMFHPAQKTTVAVAPPSSGALEAALVSTHRQSTYAWEVAGVGLSPTDYQMDTDSQPARPAPASLNGWNEDDLDSL